MKGSDRVSNISKYDFVQMINRYNHDVKDTIQYINELADEIDSDYKKFTKELREENYDLADRTENCRKCGEPLEVIDIWKESRGEMLGREVYEDMYKLGCTKCGYIKQ
jgi:predicted Zn-ribbon and HTH transcriptional regulator